MKIFFYLFLITSQIGFAQQSKPFKTCSKTVNYAVDDLVLRKKVGMDLKVPVSNPTYFGGTQALKSFFAANPIDDSIYIFRTLIGFVVNCKGEIGNMEIISDAKDDKVQQALTVAKKMPRWKPAISEKGKPIDSYQVITLTVKGSQIIDVEYK